MATRYAVASGNWSDTTSVWSDTDGGAPGSFVPVNGDVFVIRAGVSVLMDADQSGMATGMAAGNIIRGGSTPGMLYFANGTNGYLKFVDLSGTLDTNRGRLLVNSDGSWGTSTPLQQSNTAVLEISGNTSSAGINNQNLDIKLYATHPTNKYVETYYNSASTYFSVSTATDVDTTDGWISLGAAPPNNGTRVKLKPLAGGVLPTGLEEDNMYTVVQRSTSPNRCKLSPSNINFTPVIPSAVGSGSFALYTGYTTANITQTFSVFQDVTSDTPWQTTSDFNRVVLCDSWAASIDNQRGQLSSITASTVTVSFNNTGNNLDSSIDPGGRMYLVSRNVSLRSSFSSATYSFIFGNFTSGQTAILDCEIINLASHANTTQTVKNGVAVYRCDSDDITFTGVSACLNSVFTQSDGAVAYGGYSIDSTYGHSTGTAPGNFVVSGYFDGVNYPVYNTGSVFTVTTDFRAQGVNYAIYQCPGDFTFSGSIYGSAQGFSSCTGNFTATADAKMCVVGTAFASANGIATIDGHYCNFSYLMNGCFGPFIFTGDAVHGLYGINNCDASYIFQGSLSALYYSAFSSCEGPFLVTGEVSNLASTAYVFNSCQGPFIVCGATFDGGNTVFYNSDGFRAYGITITGFSTEHSSTSNYFSGRGFAASYNHNGTANDTRMWTISGTMIREDVIVPADHDYAHKFTFTNAGYTTMMEWPIDRPMGGTISIDVYAKNDSTGLAESERLHWALVDLSDDPFSVSGGSYLDEFISADSTDWQSDTLTYVQTDDRPLVLRVWAVRGSGNAYAVADPQTGGAPASSGGSYAY